MSPDDLAWGTVTPKKCRHPKDKRLRTSDVTVLSGGYPPADGTEVCQCGAVITQEAKRRGRNNRARGNAIERDVCKLLGISRVGQYGGSEDGGKADEWIAVQVKSGGTYPERIDRLLRALPERIDRIRGVVHADTPGPGGRRRMLITLDLREFAAWYGGKDEEAA